LAKTARKVGLGERVPRQPERVGNSEENLLLCALNPLPPTLVVVVVVLAAALPLAHVFEVGGVHCHLLMLLVILELGGLGGGWQGLCEGSAGRSVERSRGRELDLKADKKLALDKRVLVHGHAFVVDRLDVAGLDDLVFGGFRV
jgi:hypothetical protein